MKKQAVKVGSWYFLKHSAQVVRVLKIDQASGICETEKGPLVATNGLTAPVPPKDLKSTGLRASFAPRDLEVEYSEEMYARLSATHERYEDKLRASELRQKSTRILAQRLNELLGTNRLFAEEQAGYGGILGFTIELNEQLLKLLEDVEKKKK